MGTIIERANSCCNRRWVQSLESERPSPSSQKALYCVFCGDLDNLEATLWTLIGTYGIRRCDLCPAPDSGLTETFWAPDGLSFRNWSPVLWETV